ncbi:hypothetical protein N3K66_004655 [Trichothecium roseum]|uniref:Uncharacterized protein n=1 Tax=Trichothecium roseum TaxID=47278 RepID=A0ACC0V3W0_9HYPO|nr:hypothetical protein N3K66_004655 [Trichothecium roseum]
MAPAPKPSLPAAAKPRFGAAFDPWNSSSSGHQRPENNPGGGTGWRTSRGLKLNAQLGTAAGGADKNGVNNNAGGRRMSDTWGAGSEDWDGELGTIVLRGLRARRGRTVADFLTKPGRMSQCTASSSPSAPAGSSSSSSKGEETLMDENEGEEEEEDEEGRKITAEHNDLGTTQEETAAAKARALFDGVVVYVNGSTYPLVSDHRLKQLLVGNGAVLSLHLGRKRVTHVILGKPTGSSLSSGPGRPAGDGGGGGGLAGGKMEKEIRKVHGVGIKFVGVEWVLESLKAGKRLPEARFPGAKVAPSGQGTVYGVYAGRK